MHTYTNTHRFDYSKDDTKRRWTVYSLPMKISQANDSALDTIKTDKQRFEVLGETRPVAVKPVHPCVCANVLMQGQACVCGLRGDAIAWRLA
jgi:hypothetical protein